MTLLGDVVAAYGVECDFGEGPARAAGRIDGHQIEKQGELVTGDEGPVDPDFIDNGGAKGGGALDSCSLDPGHGCALPAHQISRLHADDIIGPIAVTALEADAGLRYDFLRWLANVDQSVSSPWDGDRSAGVIQRMANALIMMAATHAEEAMAPSSADYGNLSFAAGAVALGTGCEAIGGAHLSIRRQPDDWGVDALILSAANEVVVQDLAGRVLDGGMPTTMMTAARRVRPAIIQNDGTWRGRLQQGLDAWKAAVAEEFAALRARQDAEVKGVIE